MDKKTRSKPMKEIIKRLPAEMFEVIIFPESMILNDPVDTWPRVECLIAFYSNGFPLHKAIEYSETVKPFLLNDLQAQVLLQDRRSVYDMLESIQVPVAKHVYLERDKPGAPCEIEEFDDYIIVNGVQINKPLLEKPVDADNHNIHIYYPVSAGGGTKRLFRKVKNRSSEFYPNENDLRTEGSYIYEEFMVTQGTDVKVYTVGPNYGHAEARKSPVVDGKVHRDKDGLEVRYPVILSPTEKDISGRITIAFKQTVCGFDFLRVDGKSFVCDVNGWSFVKNSRKYYDDCSQILIELMCSSLRPEYRAAQSTVQPLVRGPTRKPGTGSSAAGGPLSPLGRLSPMDDSSNSAALDDSTTSRLDTPPQVDQEELRCVISIIRHGDRTPKQKLKLKVTDERYLNFFHDNVTNSTKNLKLKSRVGLISFLALTKEVTESADESGCNGSIDAETLMKLRAMRNVLEREEITGINRKLQMKPEKWTEKVALKSATSATEGVTTLAHEPVVETRACEVQIILKWGGGLTLLGRRQAEQLGASFRHQMYPDPGGGGVLRLHSTFRHDLKIKASDEGRVMKTAAAFAKGLLELEGSSLTPVMASLVTVQEKNNQMLDHYDNAEIKTDVDRCKAHVKQTLQMDREFTPEMLDEITPLNSVEFRERLLKLGNPYKTLKRMHELIQNICKELNERIAASVEPDQSVTQVQTLVDAVIIDDDNDDDESDDDDSPETKAAKKARRKAKKKKAASLEEEQSPEGNETPYLMVQRWETICKDFYKKKENSFDLTKVPDLHDMTRYDHIHNGHLGLTSLEELRTLCKFFADCVVPQEYGVDETDKRQLGSKMCNALLHKIEYDLKVATGTDNDDMQFSLDHSHAEDLNIRTLGRCVRTRLYFSSESHLYTLLNVLMYSGTPPEYHDSCLSEEGRRTIEETAELSYLTQITIRLFDTPSKNVNDPERFRCEISFSPGALDDETEVIPPPVVLNKNINCAQMLQSLKMSIAAGKSQCNTPKHPLSIRIDPDTLLSAPQTTPQTTPDRQPNFSQSSASYTPTSTEYLPMPCMNRDTSDNPNIYSRSPMVRVTTPDPKSSNKAEEGEFP